MERTIISSKDFNAYFGTNHAVKNVSIEIPKNHIVAVMGPSGCGKTTYLRCINRLHELTPGATSDGKMMLYNEDIYEMHPIFARLKIGMVFQRPNPFPNLSIYDNVIAGYKLNGIKLPKNERDKCHDDEDRDQREKTSEQVLPKLHATLLSIPAWPRPRDSAPGVHGDESGDAFESIKAERKRRGRAPPIRVLDYVFW